MALVKIVWEEQDRIRSIKGKMLENTDLHIKIETYDRKFTIMKKHIIKIEEGLLE
jgi:RNase P/RNase MRP subunit p29